jgi:hypothetical protein
LLCLPPLPVPASPSSSSAGHVSRCTRLGMHAGLLKQRLLGCAVYVDHVMQRCRPKGRVFGGMVTIKTTALLCWAPVRAAARDTHRHHPDQGPRHWMSPRRHPPPPAATKQACLLMPRSQESLTRRRAAVHAGHSKHAANNIKKLSTATEAVTSTTSTSASALVMFATCSVRLGLDECRKEARCNRVCRT